MGQCWHKARAQGSLEGTTSVESLTLSVAAEGPQRCSGEGALGFAALSSNPAQPSEYFSARIQEMIERKGEFATAVDSEIEASEVHWSELPELAESNKQRSVEADKAFFESLRQQHDQGRRMNFFNYLSDQGWELGEKIAEGAQGAIYGVKREGDEGDDDGMVVKVFKAEAGSLEALHKQWPPGMLKAIQSEPAAMFSTGVSCALFYGVMLDDGRFGFLMKKYWGDLRKMIDGRMMHNGDQASPFDETTGFEIMHDIAWGMRELHRNGIVHRDLKASNVLIQPRREDNPTSSWDSFDPLNDMVECFVADFEASAMTVGTKFWRAPEILDAMKNRSFKSDTCTEMSDVYSFGMTCYEILTGKIPFEGVPSSDYEIVLGGKRPELPSDTHPWIRSMINSCWHHVPSKRPSFHEILEKFLPLQGI